MNKELIIVGSNQGDVFAYYRNTEQLHTVFRHEDKEYSGNAVTCIDSHPTRSNFLVIGFMRGQILLLDLQEG